MNINSAIDALYVFVENNKNQLGEIKLSQYQTPIDARNFHLEYKRLSQELGNSEGKVGGLYLYFSKNDNKVLYVGISVDVYTRFLQHIGKGFSFGDEGGFPNFDLVMKYQKWCSEEARKILTNGDFFVQVIQVLPYESTSLLESFLIYYGKINKYKPELNVEF